MSQQLQRLLRPCLPQGRKKGKEDEIKGAGGQRRCRVGLVHASGALWAQVSAGVELLGPVYDWWCGGLRRLLGRFFFFTRLLGRWCAPFLVGGAATRST